MMAIARFVSGILLLSLPAWLLAQAPAPASVSDATVISHSADLSLTAADYRLLFAGPPLVDLKQMTQSDHNLRETALDFHSGVSMALQAEAQGLAEEPQVKARLERARRQVLIEALLASTRAAVQIPDDLVPLARERYLSDRKAFYIPQERRIAQILLTDVKSCACDEEVQLTALERAQDLRAKLVDGADFAQAARELSEDAGSASRGGELSGWVAKDGSLVKSFEEAAFALDKPGAISEPVVTQYGIHLIKLLEVKEARIQEFDEVSDRIIAKLKSEIVATSVQQLLSNAYPDPNTIDLDTLNKVATQSLLDRGVQVVLPAAETP